MRDSLAAKACFAARDRASAGEAAVDRVPEAGMRRLTAGAGATSALASTLTPERVVPRARVTVERPDRRGAGIPVATRDAPV